MAPRLQAQRYEYKYHVTEAVARSVCAVLATHMRPDRYSAEKENRCYPVCSVYLDSPDLRLYRAALDGECNRFKLRLRYYGQGENQTVFAEIKRRENNVIFKQRVALDARGARDAARGQVPPLDASQLMRPDTIRSLDAFVRLASLLDARPVARVVYEREAWEGCGEGSDLRVTLDRRVLAEPTQTLDFRSHVRHAEPVFGDAVILELKFTDRFPTWLRDLVTMFGLKNQGAAKYVTGLEHHEALHPVFAFAS